MVRKAVILVALALFASTQGFETTLIERGERRALVDLPLYSVGSSGDDAEEQEDGTVELTGQDLDVGVDPTSTGRGNFKAAVRFTGIQVPSGATITNAQLIFTSDEDSVETAPVVNIAAHDSSNPPSFQAQANNISSRPKTQAVVQWNNIGPWQTGTAYSSPNLASIVQELVDRSDWVAGKPMVFILENPQTNDRHRAIVSYDQSTANCAKLSISYNVATGAPTSAPTSSPVPLPPGVIATPAPTTVRSGETQPVTRQPTTSNGDGTGSSPPGSSGVKPSDESNLGLIIGALVGGVVVAAGGAFYLTWKRFKRDFTDDDDPEIGSAVSSPSNAPKVTNMSPIMQPYPSPPASPLMNPRNDALMYADRPAIPSISSEF